MIEPTCEQIDRLRLWPQRQPGLWSLHFRSPHAGCHQLYANGELIDATDTPAQRTFQVATGYVAQELAIVAVDPARRWEDASNALPAALRRPPWLVSFTVIRSMDHRPGQQLWLRHDHATGTIQDETKQSREIWPTDRPHPGFGQGRFGAGGFGIDGDLAIGWSAGLFGLGPFGLGGDAINFRLALQHDGLHQIHLQAVSPDGGQSPPLTRDARSFPPPAPPGPHSLRTSTTQPEILILTPGDA